MIIRPYKTCDQACVIALWKSSGLVKPQNNPEKDIARKLKKDPDLFLIGENQQGIIASIMGGYEGHRGWINYLAVAPSMRRQGLGEQLMRAIELLLQAKGCPKINLQIRHANLTAIKFYQALGYIDDEVISFGKRLEKD